MSNFYTSVIKSRLIILLYVIFIAQNAISATHLDIIFDIDSVLVDYWPAGTSTTADDQIITIQGKQYRVANGIGEVMNSLLSMSQVRISFFSAAEESRNKELLSKIYIRNGYSLFDLAEGRIFSKQNTSRDGKNIAIIRNDINLDNAVLVDDNKKNMYPHQEDNFLWLEDVGLAQHFKINSFSQLYEQLKLAAQYGMPELATEIKTAFYQQRNRLALARGAIEFAYKESLKNGTSFRTEIVRLQKDGRLKDKTQLYLLGEKKMKESNPSFNLISADKTPALLCKQALSI